MDEYQTIKELKSKHFDHRAMDEDQADVYSVMKKRMTGLNA